MFNDYIKEVVKQIPKDAEWAKQQEKKILRNLNKRPNKTHDAINSILGINKKWRWM